MNEAGPLTDCILEVGIGSGYQAAILSRLVAEVYTIEIIEPLAKRAEADLRRLGFLNVKVLAGDGYKGWPEHAPFDSVIVTCAPEHIPQALIDQLQDGGRIISRLCPPCSGNFDGSFHILLTFDLREVQLLVSRSRICPTAGRAYRPQCHFFIKRLDPTKSRLSLFKSIRSDSL